MVTGPHLGQRTPRPQRCRQRRRRRPRLWQRRRLRVARRRSTCRPLSLPACSPPQRWLLQLAQRHGPPPHHPRMPVVKTGVIACSHHKQCICSSGQHLCEEQPLNISKLVAQYFAALKLLNNVQFYGAQNPSRRSPLKSHLETIMHDRLIAANMTLRSHLHLRKLPV